MARYELGTRPGVFLCNYKNLLVLRENNIKRFLPHSLLLAAHNKNDLRSDSCLVESRQIRESQYRADNRLLIVNRSSTFAKGELCLGGAAN